MQTYYQKAIAEIVGPSVDPRHVEGYMRLEYSTLNGLSRTRFNKVARECAMAVQADPKAAEANAVSFGL